MAPENTLASFEACARAGVGAVELDARLSSDGEVIVHHDAELGRIIAGSGAIHALDAAALRARGIPLLDEVLALPLLVDVELKADAENVARLPARAVDAVRRAGAEDRVLFTSFDAELADEAARLLGRPGGLILPYPPDADELASYPRLAYVALAEDAALQEAIAVAKKAERRVLVWTVNDIASARRLFADGADGIITDRPSTLARAPGADATAG